MRKSLILMGALAALLVPTASRAQVQLGLRLGYAPAMGDAAKDAKMKDFAIKSQVPIQLDAMYAVNRDIAVGGYFSYGFGQVDGGAFEGACDISGVDCSGSNMRVGIQGFYTFNQVKSALVPWAGVGFGWEQTKVKLSGGGATADLTASGWELLNLQLGGDYKVSDQFSFGPYVMFSLAQYGTAKLTNNVDPSFNMSGSIDEKAMHEFVAFGVRGKFDL